MSEETGWRSTSKDFREDPRWAEQRPPGGIPEIYEFGPYRLEPGERKLLHGNEVVALTPKAFDTLYALVRESGHLVEKNDLIRMLWPHSVVEEGNLTNNIFQLRKALGEDPQYIETVPRKGYRFLGAVRRLPEAQRTLPEKPPERETEGLRWWSRPTVLALLAAVLVLVGSTAAYFNLPRTGQRAVDVFPAIHSLAVLPLENLSGDKEEEYFADGMTDALITDLAQIGSLRVISRTSAMHFKGSQKTLPQIGRDLKVDAVVEGTVARGERRVRVTAQLIQASSDQHLWARTYERDLKDILVLQDEIARDITEQIRIKLTPKERSLLTEARPVDPEAYDAYLRGRYWWGKGGAENWKALYYFHKAIAKDPSYALAYSGVADSYLSLGGGFLPPKEAFPKAREAAIRALELDTSLAEAHASMASVKFFNDWDWSGAVNEIRQAIAFNPNNASAHRRYASYLAAVGRFDEALKEIERGRDLDPFSIASNFGPGDILFAAHRYDDAVHQIRQALEMFPDVFDAYNTIADIYEHQKMFAEAFAARQQALSMQKDPTVGALAEAYKRGGYRGWLLKRIETLEQAPPQTIQLRQKDSHLDMMKAFGIAYFYALLDDEAHAMPYLERAYDGRNPAVLFLQVSPIWDPIRSSPRFRDLVRRIGFPQPSTDQN